MKRNYSPLQEINLVAQLADLKEAQYKNTLVITALVELLVEKEIMTRTEIIEKANELELDLTLDLVHQQSPAPRILH